MKRNQRRFPGDFIFRLTLKEKQEVVANRDHLENLKYSSALPTVFTEHGALMAAAILNTNRAAQVSLFVVRAFVKLRETLAANTRLAHQLKELERRVGEHDIEIKAIFKAIRELMTPPEPPPKRQIGFHP